MSHLDRFRTLALCSLIAIPLATTGCSKSGGSPTEPAFSDLDQTTASSTVSSVSGDSRGRGRGGDNARDDRRGRNGRRNDDRNDDRNPQAGREFEGAVTAVDGNTLRLAGGTTVVVDGQTQWNARGDLTSVREVAASLAAGKNPRVEGRGTRQANGTILARTIKAEHLGD